MTIMKIRKDISGFRFLVPMIFILCLMGCDFTPQVFKINPDQLAEYNETNKIDLMVELCLTDKFCNYTWEPPTGLRYTLSLGSSLCSNAEILCKRVFQDVVVTNGTEDSVKSDVILTPEVVFLAKTQPAYGFQMVEMEINVKWTLTNSKGKIIWIDTIEGIGQEKMGGPFSFEKNTRKQIRMAMENMFKNTYSAILVAVGN
ncbi:MAG: hypothetical protein KAJ46_05170 [Sedimentisphaerales bacterium]|nr:hypothetical protein [Sedimentisphaerales bacterium]